MRRSEREGQEGNGEVATRPPAHHDPHSARFMPSHWAPQRPHATCFSGSRGEPSSPSGPGPPPPGTWARAICGTASTRGRSHEQPTPGPVRGVGVTRTAFPAQISRAYRTLLRTHHPDTRIPNTRPPRHPRRRRRRRTEPRRGAAAGTGREAPVNVHAGSGWVSFVGDRRAGGCDRRRG